MLTEQNQLEPFATQVDIVTPIGGHKYQTAKETESMNSSERRGPEG